MRQIFFHFCDILHECEQNFTYFAKMHANVSFLRSKDAKHTGKFRAINVVMCTRAERERG
jgi:hypothetical protein